MLHSWQTEKSFSSCTISFLIFFFQCIEIHTGDTYFTTEEEYDWVLVKDMGSGKRMGHYSILLITGPGVHIKYQIN